MLAFLGKLAMEDLYSVRDKDVGVSSEGRNFHGRHHHWSGKAILLAAITCGYL